MKPVDMNNESLLTGEWGYDSIDTQIGDVVLDPNRHLEAKVHPLLAKFMPANMRSPWFVMFGIGFTFVNVLLLCITILVLTGIGVWGNNQPSGWGFDIINFV
ncbi:MAG: hypothetical protein JSS66_17165, partial [Armatimonadetes bacterium]|nr:hypothetical protein [Armatimonadota bacterium]